MNELIVIITSICFGSFANNIISFYSGGSKFDWLRSSCSCGERELRYYELIPLLSFIIQKSKCRGCNREIPFRYFLIELITGIMGITCYMKFDLTFSFFFHFFLFYTLLLIAVVDFNVYRIPNQLFSFLLLLAVIKSFMVQNDILWNIITAVSITCLFLLINQFYLKAKRKLAIGYGDIKLIAVLMLTFDIPTALIGLWLSSLIAIPGFYMLRKILKDNVKDEKIPFGFFLGLAYGCIALVLRDILPFSHIFESF